MTREMTREQKLWSMTMKMLVIEADRAGVKINKKASKQKAIERILAAETCSDGTLYSDVMAEIVAGAEKKAEATQEENAVAAAEDAVAQEQIIVPLCVDTNDYTLDVTGSGREAYREAIEKYLTVHGYAIKTWEKVPNVLAVKEGKTTIGEFYFGKKTLRINVKEKRAQLRGVEYVIIHNYYLPATIRDIPYENARILPVLVALFF